jgi:hypothetical protein
VAPALADLLLDHFLDVLDALALVRLGGRSSRIFAAVWPSRFAVGARERDAVLVDLARDSLGQLEDDGVRVAERHRERVARDLGAVTDAVDLELACPSRPSRP